MIPVVAAVLIVGCAPGRPPLPIASPEAVALAAADRVRLAESFRLAASIGDEIWPGWSRAPFAVLLVTPEREFLLRHPRPSADFVRVDYDSLLGTDVFVRRRVFAPTLLATFPAVGGVPTIVIGQPANTGKSSTAWVLTMLHEHFHQLQYSRPDYYSGVDALGLARGDATGMWMLNYAFPYDSETVRSRVAAFASALADALADSVNADRSARQTRWGAVVDARARLRTTLADDDDRYLAFQMWQEGVARYTELQVARWAATHYTPSPAFVALDDATNFAGAADSIESGIRAGLRDDPLARSKRVAFYPIGAAMALALDHASPGWRRHYFERGYSLDAQFP